MTPHHIFQTHPKVVSYFKVAVIGAILSVGVTLANNERLNEAKNESDAQFIYSINRAACGAYSLVDPTIKTDNTLLVTLDRVIHDPKTSAKSLAQTRARRASVVKQLNAFQSYRSIYSPIPVNFDCAKLPKKPPS